MDTEATDNGTPVQTVDYRGESSPSSSVPSNSTVTPSREIFGVKRSFEFGVGRCATYENDKRNSFLLSFYKFRVR